MTVSHTDIDKVANHNFAALIFTLSVLLPSSACSATVRSGNCIGIIRLGTAPGMTEYFEKSLIPVESRKKSSSSSNLPLTSDAGARSIASIASEKIVAFLRSLTDSGSV